MLGKKAAGYISSIISATKANEMLSRCEPNSILSASVIAATLDLPIQNNLGFAALVPYNESYKDEAGKWQKRAVAQFQMMWKGYVQLAMRTGQYQTMNVCEVYEGELIKFDRFSGMLTFDSNKKASDKIVGYTAYFKMVNGFEKTVYWTVEQIIAHAMKYSKSFENEKGQWKNNFDAMAKKTVLKNLLSKFGILSVDMQLQQAIMADQAAVTEEAEYSYVDNDGQPPLEVEITPELLLSMLNKHYDSMVALEIQDARRIIDKKEEVSYKKLYKVLMAYEKPETKTEVK